MRDLPLALLPLSLLAACAGNVADYIGPPSSIIAAQLTRYGLTEPQARCVGESLGGTLTPVQLRHLERLAAAVTEGYYEPGRLTVRDFTHVASSMSDEAVGQAVVRATASCDALPEMVTRREGETAPADSAGAATATTPAGAPRPPTWLNLGAAPTGQSIAVDAASITQEPNARTAWFRLTNPNVSTPGDESWLLKVDCAARTIDPVAFRRFNAAGGVAEYREYGAAEEGPMPIEGGTVMEIAYLALCT